jgi:hypothetical protein
MHHHLNDPKGIAKQEKTMLKAKRASTANRRTNHYGRMESRPAFGRRPTRFYQALEKIRKREEGASAGAGQGN